MARCFPIILSLALAVIMPGAGGCKYRGLGAPPDKPRGDSSAKNAQPGAPGGDDGTGAHEASVIPAGADVLAAQYQVSVYAGPRICRGDVIAKVKANIDKDGQLLEIPQGKVRCLAGLLGEFDLAEAFAGLAKTKTGEDHTGLEVKDYVIRLKGWQSYVYAPPYRPFLPSFLAAPKAQLKALMLEEKVRTKLKDDPKAPVIEGVVGMRTISMDDPYKAPVMGRTFKKNLRFEVVNKGFEGIEKLGSILFDRLEMVVSMDPFAVPLIILETRVKDLAAAAPDAAGGLGAGTATKDPLTGAITGLVKLMKVRIELELKIMKGLPSGD